MKNLERAVKTLVGYLNTINGRDMLDGYVDELSYSDEYEDVRKAIEERGLSFQPSQPPIEVSSSPVRGEVYVFDRQYGRQVLVIQDEWDAAKLPDEELLQWVANGYHDDLEGLGVPMSAYDWSMDT